MTNLLGAWYPRLRRGAPVGTLSWLNYLAHLRLAPPDPLLRLGNLLGDFRRGVALEALPDPLRRGVEQHMALDRFTDAHHVFRRSRARLDAPFRRLSGVLVDVFYDHFLARDWQRWGDGRTLRAFADEMYALLFEHRATLPERLARAAPHMTRHDWLGSYASIDGVAEVLERMATRMRRENVLARGAEQLRTHYAELQADFEAFFPEALTHTSHHIDAAAREAADPDAARRDAEDRPAAGRRIGGRPTDPGGVPPTPGPPTT